jgi:hypothetical protein
MVIKASGKHWFCSYLIENVGDTYLIIFYLVHDKKECDTMGERIGRIGRIETDFFLIFYGFQAHAPQKKIRWYPPNPPNPFSHRITKPLCAKYIMIFLNIRLIFFPIVA